MTSHFQFKLISKQALSILKVLRENASEVLVTNGKQLCTEIIDICATVLNIFSKKIVSDNTKCRKQIFKIVWNIWKYWGYETDDETLPVFAQFLWTLNYFFEFPWESFLVIFQATVHIF